MAEKKGQEPQPPVLDDGPAAPTPEPTPAPKLASVKYGDKEYHLPEEAAQAWEQREREYARKLSQHSDELGQLRKWKTQVEQQIAPKPQEPDLNTLWFENPSKAAELIEQKTYQRVRTEYEEREKAREQQQALDRFFDGFYRKNDDLRDDDWVVKGVMQEHFEDLADLPTVKAQEKLADLTRERIIRLTRKVKTSDTTRSRQTLAEPASGERAPRPAPTEDAGPGSLGDVIRERAARRQAAARGRVATRT